MREMEYHSNNCHRHCPSVDAKISRQKFEQKQGMRSLQVSPPKEWVIIKGKIVFLQWRLLADTTLTKGQRFICYHYLTSYVSSAPSPSHNPWYVHWWGTSLPPNKAQPRCNHKKTPDKPRRKDIPPNNWSGPFKSVKVIKGKERLRKCQRWEKTKET